MDLSVEEFWRNYEREIGEKVLSRTMAQRFVSAKDRGDWGLLVLSSSALRFRKTPSENWFSSLFRASPAKVPESQVEDSAIPFSSILEVSDPPKKLLDMLFGSPFRQITVRFSASGAETQVRFAVDPKSDLLARLKDCLAR
jgi:hypothetical protein